MSLHLREAWRRIAMRDMAYRGVPVPVRSSQQALDLLKTLKRGALGEFATEVVQIMATAERNRWWTTGEPIVDEAGRWWTNDRDSAWLYALGDAGPQDEWMVPVVMTASFEETDWQHGQELDAGGSAWWHLDAGTPMTITEMVARIPIGAAIDHLIEEIEVHDADISGWANWFIDMDDVRLPLSPMRTTANWRAQQAYDYWNLYDAVIATDRMGSRRSFDVFTMGQQIAQRPSLAEAKAAVEEVYGPQPWRRVAMPPVTVVHPYFGPTTEFTDPTSILVVDHLPVLA